MQAPALFEAKRPVNLVVVPHVVAEADIGFGFAAVAAISRARQNGCNRGNIGSGSTSGDETKLPAAAEPTSEAVPIPLPALPSPPLPPYGVADRSGTFKGIALLQVDVVDRLHGIAIEVQIDIDTDIGIAVGHGRSRIEVLIVIDIQVAVPVQVGVAVQAGLPLQLPLALPLEAQLPLSLPL